MLIAPNFFLSQLLKALRLVQYVCIGRYVYARMYVRIQAMPPPCSFLMAGISGTAAWPHADVWWWKEGNLPLEKKGIAGQALET